MGKFSEAFGKSSDQKEDLAPPPSFHEATSSSFSPPGQQSFQQGSTPTYACLLLSSRDKLRTVNFPEQAIGPIQEAITRVWQAGIQNQGYQTPQNHEWKLRGNPWYGSGSEAIWARRLILHILHGLAASGWHVLVSADLTKKQYDKDSIFFKSGPPLQRNMFCISFNESDKIRMIDPPNDQILEAFKSVIAQCWTSGIQEAKWKEEGCWQFKLKGNPWYTSSGDQINTARLLMCHLLGAMDQQGFELIASVDQNVGTDNVGELDTWYFASKLPNGQRL